MLRYLPVRQPPVRSQTHFPVFHKIFLTRELHTLAGKHERHSRSCAKAIVALKISAIPSSTSSKTNKQYQLDNPTPRAPSLQPFLAVRSTQTTSTEQLAFQLIDTSFHRNKLTYHKASGTLMSLNGWQVSLFGFHSVAATEFLPQIFEALQSHALFLVLRRCANSTQRVVIVQSRIG